jgi:hypothetical protein
VTSDHVRSLVGRSRIFVTTFGPHHHHTALTGTLVFEPFTPEIGGFLPEDWAAAYQRDCTKSWAKRIAFSKEVAGVMCSRNPERTNGGNPSIKLPVDRLWV